MLEMTWAGWHALVILELWDWKFEPSLGNLSKLGNLVSKKKKLKGLRM